MLALDSQRPDLQETHSVVHELPSPWRLAAAARDSRRARIPSFSRRGMRTSSPRRSSRGRSVIVRTFLLDKVLPIPSTILQGRDYYCHVTLTWKMRLRAVSQPGWADVTVPCSFCCANSSWLWTQLLTPARCPVIPVGCGPLSLTRTPGSRLPDVLSRLAPFRPLT